MKALLLISILALSAFPLFAQTNIITAVAGNGSSGYSGDGGTATNASLNNPTDMAVDNQGNLFIADYNNQRIRRVDANGIITTVAGNGSTGYSGDGGAATNASLNYPEGVALDANGNLFIADGDNSRVRKVGTNGIVTTVAGNGSAGYSGDGGAATGAELNHPCGVALDAYGNLFITDQAEQRIREVGTNGIITTVAGNGSAGYSGDGGAAVNASLNNPIGVAVDNLGDLFIAGYQDQRIRKVGTNGVITTVAGNGSAGYSGDGGAATNAGLNYPTRVAVDSQGNLFIADYNNQRIRRVDANGIITTVAGNGSIGYSGDGGPATNAGLYNPEGVALDAVGNLFIDDRYHERVRKVNFLTPTNPPTIMIQPQSQYAAASNSVSLNVFANGTPALSYQWRKNGTNLTDVGNISGSTTTDLVLNPTTTNDTGNYDAIVTNAYGSVTSSVAVLTVVPTVAIRPIIVIQPTNRTVFVTSNATFSVAVFGAGPFTYQWQFNGTNLPTGIGIITTVAGNGSEGYLGNGGAATNAGMYYPEGVALDADGNLFIADSSNQRIRKVDTNGAITTVAGNGSSGYSGDGNAATSASLSYPGGVALDADGNLFIVDESNQRIRKVDTKGVITTVAGNGSAGYSGDGGAATNASLYDPSGVALDVDGNLFIADELNHRIREVDTNGIITTVAGNGSSGSSGDGGAATSASLSSPDGVAMDADGNLFIADPGPGSLRVRKVDPKGIITTVAGNGSAGYSGDGGAATNASLYPEAAAVDADGKLFIADYSHYRIREVDAKGIIATVAGNGSAGYSGDGGAATSASLSAPVGVALDTDGNLFIADKFNQRIRKVYFSGSPLLSLSDVTFDNAGNYSVVVANDYGSVTSSVVTLTIKAIPPAIQREPSSINAVTGSFPSFSVAGNGTPPLFYQWYFNDIPIPTATNSSLQLQAVTTNQNGSYFVVVTNAGGFLASAPAILTVFDPVSILSQTTNIATAYGFTENMSVTAVGTALDFQWYFGTAAISGATNASLTLTNIGNANAGTYYVVVSNAVSSVKSQPIQVSAYTAVRILPTGSWLGVNPPIGYWPSVPMTYTIKAGPPSGTIDYALQEQITSGNGAEVSIGPISDGGVFNAGTSTINWGPFFDNSTRALTYVITPLPGMTNWIQFNGVISINGTNATIVGGSEINLLPLDPADNGGEDAQPVDNFIGINEVTAYGNAWKYDTFWPVVPNPIPISYVTSAGVIWKQGEYYIYNPSLGAPPACWVNATPPPGIVAPAIASRLSSSVKSRGEGPIPLDDSTSTAICSMPGICTNNVPVTVTLTVTPASSVGVYAVEDKIPLGWAATNFSTGGAFDSINNEVKYGPFFDNSARILTYQVTPPTNFTGAAIFSGTASYDGLGMPITGVRQLISNATPPVFQQATLSPKGLVLTWSSVPTLTYQLQYSTNLASTNWMNVGSVLTGSNATLSVTNTLGLNPQGFYRVLLR